MDSNTEGLVTITSDESAQATVSRIESAIEESPLTLMTTVDHADNATSIEKELPPTTLLLFGDPDVGTPLMQASRTIGLNLPQRMLVWEENDRVHVTYNDLSYVAERHGIDGQADRLESISDVLRELATGDPSTE